MGRLISFLPPLVVLLLAIGYVEMRRPNLSPASGSEDLAGPAAPDRDREVDPPYPPPDWESPRTDPAVLERLEDLTRRLERLEARPTPTLARPERSPEATATPEDAPAAAPDDKNSERAGRVREFLARLASGTVTESEIDDLWDQLVGSGAEDEAIAAFRAYVKDHPDDPNAYYGLGTALVGKLLGEQVSFMDQARLGGEADRMYSKALDIDDKHFGARFSKAYGYTFWPDSAGMGPEAIRHFEILRSRHGADASQPLMEEVYISLGTQYGKAGNFRKATEIFREGHRTFPDSRRLKSQVEAGER